MSDDESAPAFAWTDFYELAKDLAERGDEAGYRSSVSRSYYAVFHVTQLVLERHDPEYAAMRSRDSHKQVWDRLAALDRRQAKSAVRGARSLLHERKEADYRREARDWPRRAKQSLGTAERVLRSLIDLLN